MHQNLKLFFAVISVAGAIITMIPLVLGGFMGVGVWLQLRFNHPGNLVMAALPFTLPAAIFHLGYLARFRRTKGITDLDQFMALYSVVVSFIWVSALTISGYVFNSYGWLLISIGCISNIITHYNYRPQRP